MATYVRADTLVRFLAELVFRFTAENVSLRLAPPLRSEDMYGAPFVVGVDGAWLLSQPLSIYIPVKWLDIYDVVVDGVRAGPLGAAVRQFAGTREHHEKALSAKCLLDNPPLSLCAERKTCRGKYMVLARWVVDSDTRLDPPDYWACIEFKLPSSPIWYADLGPKGDAHSAHGPELGPLTHASTDMAANRAFVHGLCKSWLDERHEFGAEVSNPMTGSVGPRPDQEETEASASTKTYAVEATQAAAILPDTTTKETPMSSTKPDHDVTSSTLATIKDAAKQGATTAVSVTAADVLTDAALPHLPVFHGLDLDDPKVRRLVQAIIAAGLIALMENSPGLLPREDLWLEASKSIISQASFELLMPLLAALTSSLPALESVLGKKDAPARSKDNNGL